MLEKPDLPDDALVACLGDAYGVRAAEIAFLPLGADVNTAVYRAVADDATPYFVKLRRGAFDEAGVAIPRLLAEQGDAHVIVPLETGARRLWARLDNFTVLLYPYVTGRDGYEVELADRQVIELGAALRNLHALAVPPEILRNIPRETHSGQWRERVSAFQERVERDAWTDPVAAATAALLRAERAPISALVGRAAELGDTLRSRALDAVVCHADIHAGNVLIADDGALYIVDWDTLVVAPKEHDLMYVGSGLLGGRGRDSAREAALFYQGYGPVEVDQAALAYYRYERIVQDIAAFCEQLLLSDAGGTDREQSLRWLSEQFLPGHVIEIAFREDAAG